MTEQDWILIGVLIVVIDAFGFMLGRLFGQRTSIIWLPLALLGLVGQGITGIGNAIQRAARGNRRNRH